MRIGSTAVILDGAALDRIARDECDAFNARAKAEAVAAGHRLRDRPFLAAANWIKMRPALIVLIWVVRSDGSVTENENSEIDDWLSSWLEVTTSSSSSLWDRKATAIRALGEGLRPTTDEALASALHCATTLSPLEKKELGAHLDRLKLDFSAEVHSDGVMAVDTVKRLIRILEEQPTTLHLPMAYPSDLAAGSAEQEATAAFYRSGDLPALTDEQASTLLDYREFAMGVVERWAPHLRWAERSEAAEPIAIHVSRDREIAEEVRVVMRRRFERGADSDRLGAAIARLDCYDEISAEFEDEIRERYGR